MEACFDKENMPSGQAMLKSGLVYGQEDYRCVPTSLPHIRPLGSDTLTGVNDTDYKTPFTFTGKLNKLTIKVNQPKLTEEKINKLENTQAIAVDGKPIHHMQPAPH
jgi:hypothetical protein